MPGLYHKSRVAALASGGVESAYLIYHLARSGHRVQPLYVRQGFRWESAELWSLKRLLRQWTHRRVAPLVVLTLPMRALLSRDHWSLGQGRVPGRRSCDAAMYLPGRNVSLLLAAGLWCAQHRMHRIAHGTLATNPFPDATPQFFQQMGRILTAALEHPLRCEAPLRHWTKQRVVAQLPATLLRLTWSCAHPQGRTPCGRCNKCAERDHALL